MGREEEEDRERALRDSVDGSSGEASSTLYQA